MQRLYTCAYLKLHHLHIVCLYRTLNLYPKVLRNRGLCLKLVITCFSVSQRMSQAKRSASCQILTPTSYYCMLLSYLLLATLARQGLNSRGALSAE